MEHTTDDSFYYKVANLYSGSIIIREKSRQRAKTKEKRLHISALEHKYTRLYHALLSVQLTSSQPIEERERTLMR